MSQLYPPLVLILNFILYSSFNHLHLNHAWYKILLIYIYVGFNVEALEYKNIRFTVWDVGGQDTVWTYALKFIHYYCFHLCMLNDFLSKWIWNVHFSQELVQQVVVRTWLHGLFSTRPILDVEVGLGGIDTSSKQLIFGTGWVGSTKNISVQNI